MESSRDSVALAPAPVRRACLGPPRPFDTARHGHVVTIAGVVMTSADVVAEARVCASGLLAKRRCSAPVTLQCPRGPLLLVGSLAVVVGSHERERILAPRGRVSIRQVRSGSLVRARGRLRRVPSPGPASYRDAPTTWGLCPAGLGDAVDIAFEETPVLVESPALWETLWDRYVVDQREDEGLSSSEWVLTELVRRRRARR